MIRPMLEFQEAMQESIGWLDIAIDNLKIPEEIGTREEDKHTVKAIKDIKDIQKKLGSILTSFKEEIETEQKDYDYFADMENEHSL